MAEAAGFELQEGGARLALWGDWTVDTIAALEADLRAAAPALAGDVAADISRLGRIDVAGAYLIGRTLGLVGAEAEAELRGEHPNARRLIEVAMAAARAPAPVEAADHGLRAFLEFTGRAVVNIGREIVETVAFFGHALVVLVGQLARPLSMRWVSVVHVMEVAGLNALPIIALLSFFIGVVVAYLGARILGDFGASVFTVELVAFSVMREFGVVITAILLAGRTDSAFTAEIGAMKMRQEIDAMRVIGIDPMSALVAPRILAMLVMTPILTFAAIISGLLGGMLVAWSELGVSPNMFFTRIEDAVPAQHFWVGMSKAPVFALALAVIGCKQGLSVGGDVASLGKRVTTSVVQSIFMVILIDAAFALWFLEMDL